jgi:hypothetical protein
LPRVTHTFNTRNQLLLPVDCQAAKIKNKGMDMQADYSTRLSKTITINYFGRKGESRFVSCMGSFINKRVSLTSVVYGPRQGHGVFGCLKNGESLTFGW